MTEKTFRLRDSEVQTIKQSFSKHFCQGDNLWVFGSRADVNKKGGDLDLYIETNAVDAKDAVKRKMAMVNELCTILGDQRIDVVLNLLSIDNQLPIYQIAKDTGIQLV